MPPLPSSSTGHSPPAIPRISWHDEREYAGFRSPQSDQPDAHRRILTKDGMQRHLHGFGLDLSRSVFSVSHFGIDAITRQSSRTPLSKGRFLSPLSTPLQLRTTEAGYHLSRFFSQHLGIKVLADHTKLPNNASSGIEAKPLPMPAYRHAAAIRSRQLGTVRDPFSSTKKNTARHCHRDHKRRRKTKRAVRQRG